MDIDSETAINNMWAYADKPERMRCFHKIVFEKGVEDPEVLWGQFWGIWASSENLNEDEDFIRDIVDYGKMRGSSLILDDRDRKPFEALPDCITVYRGGIEANRLGWSWSLDREKARWFAQRAYGPSERYVMRATVPKTMAMAYLTGRGESEIVLDPDEIEDAVVDEYFETENEKMGGLYYAVQSGKSFGFGDDDQRDQLYAEMMVKQISDDKVEKNIAELTEMVDFCKWAGLRSKLGYCEKALSMLRERQAEVG